MCERLLQSLPGGTLGVDKEVVRLIVWAVVVSSACVPSCTGNQPYDTPDKDVVIAPVITTQPLREVFYSIGESLTLQCEASGYPTPVYHWVRSEVYSPVSIGDQVVEFQDNGTLYFPHTVADDKGSYVCWAENVAGKTRTNPVTLKVPVLGPMSITARVTVRPVIGTAVTLSCTIPQGDPPPALVWTTVTADGTLTHPMVPNDRVIQSLQGDLHITNVDASDDQTWLCSAHNPVSRGVVHGPSYTVLPQPAHRPQQSAARLVWFSPLSQTVRSEQDVRFQCIFAGSPTPRIIWEREEEDLPVGRWFTEDRGTTLVIKSLEPSDRGRYTCIGYNQLTTHHLSKTFALSVAPALTFIRRPESQNVTEGSTATFHCEAAPSAGQPLLYSWTINGTDLLPEVMFKGDENRWKQTPHTLTISKVTLTDSMSVSCGASYSNHGIWVLTNASAYLSVRPSTNPEVVLSGNDLSKGYSPSLHTGLVLALVGWWLCPSGSFSAIL